MIPNDRAWTAARWAATDPVLMVGEIGIEDDTAYAKVGNGTRKWSELEYWSPLPSTSVDLSRAGLAWDGVEDDTERLQNAVNSVRYGSGVPAVALTGGTGTCRLTSPLVVDRRAVTFNGLGVGNPSDFASNPGQGTTLKWDGAASVPMLKLIDTRHVTFSDIYFQGNDTNVPSAAVQILNDAGGSTGTNEHLVFERCLFGYLPWRTGGYRMDKCVHVGGSVNANNDQFTFRNCQFLRPDTACAQIDNTQSIWGSFEDCVFDANGLGAKGLVTSAACTLWNAQFNGCAVDVEVNSTAQVDIFKYNSENSRKLVNIVNGGGRFIARGGRCLLSLIDGGFYATAGALAGGCLDFDGVAILTGAASPRPKLQVVGASMSGAAADATSYVSVRNCGTASADYDISSLANGRVHVSIEDGQVFDRSYLTGAVTYTPITSGGRLYGVTFP